MGVGRQRLRVHSVEAQEHILVLRAAHCSQAANVIKGIKEVFATPVWWENSRIRQAVPPAPTARQARTLTALRRPFAQTALPTL